MYAGKLTIRLIVDLEDNDLGISCGLEDENNLFEWNIIF